MQGHDEIKEREKVPVAQRQEPREAQIEAELPRYEGGFAAWRRATELPRRWRI